MESPLSLGTLHITQTMLRDISADIIKNHLMRYRFSTITLSGDSSIDIHKIIQPIRTNVLVLNYPPDIDSLVYLRTFLMISHIRKVIIKADNFVTKYLPFGTFESGTPGLFGAMIRNPNITKVVISNTDNSKKLKREFRKERKNHIDGLLIPGPRTTLKII